MVDEATDSFSLRRTRGPSALVNCAAPVPLVVHLRSRKFPSHFELSLEDLTHSHPEFFSQEQARSQVQSRSDVDPTRAQISEPLIVPLN
jgi:hypothetical protein